MRFLFGLFWHTLKKAALFTCLAALLFSAAALVLYQLGVHILWLPLYIITGALAGYFAGVTAGVRDKVEDVVRRLYPLIEPSVKRAIERVQIQRTTIRLEDFQQVLDASLQPVTGRLPSWAAGFIERRALRAIRESLLGGFLERLEQSGQVELSRETVRELFEQKLIELAAEDVRRRFAPMQWGYYALGAAVLLLPFLLVFVWPRSARAATVEHWPQFRGPGSTGVAVDDPRLPDRWSQTENLAWKTDIPGRGWSSPVVWGDHIFLTTVISTAPEEPAKKGLYLGGNRPEPPNAEHRWMVYAVDFRTGKIRWEREVQRAVPKSSRHLKNSFASETPVTDGERIYAYFGNIGLFCFDFSGKLVWQQRYNPVATRYGWGTAASPVLHRGRLYIVNDNDDQSYLASLDARTGRQIWRVNRDEKSNWATPYVWEHDGKAEIVTNGTGRIRSYDLDGKLLWELGGASSIVIPTPFSKFGLLYVTSGYVGDQNRPVFALQPGGKIAWSLPQAGPYNPSPILYGDYYYTLLDRGFFTCHDARTGKEIYGRQRLDPAAAAFTASPWAYNGKLFALSEDGDTYVIQAGPEFRVLHKNSLDDMSMATPAIARGSVIVRTASRLYRIGR
jgi:outer membrane protein assembly factor BamB